MVFSYQKYSKADSSNYQFNSCRGYLAPEYALKGHLTRRADTYSFGVLLLEIVTGRCNTNRMLPNKDCYLLERVGIYFCSCNMLY